MSRRIPRSGCGRPNCQAKQTSGIGATSDGEGQAEDAVEGGDGAEVVVVGMEPVLTFGADDEDRSQGLSAVGMGARSRSLAHGKPPTWCSYVHDTHPEGSPAIYATLEK